MVEETLPTRRLEHLFVVLVVAFVAVKNALLVVMSESLVRSDLGLGGEPASAGFAQMLVRFVPVQIFHVSFDAGFEQFLFTNVTRDLDSRLQMFVLLVLRQTRFRPLN